MITSKRPAPRIAFVVASFVLALALVPAGLAAKGGGGSTAGGQSLTGVVGSTTYTVTGSGFKPGQLVNLSIGEANGCCSATNIFANAAGGFTYTGWLVGSGRYFVDASIYNGRRWQVVASWSAQVP